MQEYQNLSKYRYNIPRERSLIFIQLYRIIDHLIIKNSPKFLNSFRVSIYRLFGATIGKNVKIQPSAHILYPWNVFIGNNCWIGSNVELSSVDKIFIGNDVAFAHNVFVSTASHDFKKVEFPTVRKSVRIEDQVWISSNVFIHMGVTIEYGVVVGACSVVTNDLMSGDVCLGNPAAPVKPRRANYAST